MELSESDNLISNRLGRLSKSRKHKRNSNSALVQKLKRRRLVFLEDSPDYCRSNSTVGFPGNNIECTLPKLEVGDKLNALESNASKFAIFYV